MGFIKQILGGGLIGTAARIAAPDSSTPDATSTSKSGTTDTAAADEEARRKRILQMNSMPGQLTLAGGDQSQPNISRKMLTGQ